MDNYYSIFNLNPKSSSKRAFQKLEKRIRKEIKLGNDVGTLLKAFVILSNPKFKGYYDKALDKPELLWKLKSSLEKAAINFAESAQTKDVQVLFSEKNFLWINLFSIIDGTFGLDFLFQGVGSSDPDFPQNERQILNNGQAAFMVSNALNFGIPVILGLIKPILWWTLVPFIGLKMRKEYKRIKHEHYFNKQSIPNKLIDN